MLNRPNLTTLGFGDSPALPQPYQGAAGTTTTVAKPGLIRQPVRRPNPRRSTGLIVYRFCTFAQTGAGHTQDDPVLQITRCGVKAPAKVDHRFAITRSRAVSSPSLKNDDYAMDLLVGSVVFGIKHAAPIMRAQGAGSIINNSSVAALRTGMGGYPYSAAKAAVTQVTRVAGAELGQFGITVNCISPGAIATPISYGGSAAARALDSAHGAAKMRKLTTNLGKATPLHRGGSSLDIARAALYLTSDEGSHVNCHDWVIDGGMTAGLFPQAT
jgi:NAD(P)-dependent dehydrogenase (short-subunit alcohol dehydrogenase family)